MLSSVGIFARWGPVVFWSLLIFLGSALPTATVSPDGTINFLVHKAVHLFEYAVLSVLSFRAKGSVFFAFGYPLLFAVSDEFHQSFVPGRGARVQDVLVDALGISVGNAIVFWFKKTKPFWDGDAASSGTAEETQKLASALVRRGRKENVFALYGNLGSGKTTFTQGLARALCITETVNSPSFTLIKEYQIPAPFQGTPWRRLYHADLYRLEPHQTSGLGLLEIMADPENLVVIEWAERWPEKWPENSIQLFFELVSETGRKIRIKGLSKL